MGCVGFVGIWNGRVLRLDLAKAQEALYWREVPSSDSRSHIEAKTPENAIFVAVRLS